MKTNLIPVVLFVAAIAPASTADAGSCPCVGRIDMGAAVDALVKDIVARTPELKHVDPSRILVVAADARHASRATTRPVKFPDGTTVSPDGKWERPRTVWNGKDVLYIVELRPKFFRRSSAEARLKTIFHELLHMSPAFDGTIPGEKSHKRGGATFDATLPGMVKRYLGAADAAVLRPIAYDGEVLMRQWLERPPNKFPAARSDARRVYGSADMFTGPIEIITKSSPLKRAIEGQGKGPLKAPTADLDLDENGD